jgi:hypothetical protein
LPPLLTLTLAAALASQLLRRWQLVLALGCLNERPHDERDALGIDAVRNGIAITEIDRRRVCRE